MSHGVIRMAAEKSVVRANRKTRRLKIIFLFVMEYLISPS
jgi:hypothetical protein